MLALPDLQKAFAGYLSGGDDADLACIVRGDSISAAARLRIHRHHVQQSLTTALAGTFPTVQTLVGEEFFEATALVFALSLLLVYFVLAGQYENWITPLAVLLAVPLALLGTVLALTALGLPNNIYVQIGLVLLIALFLFLYLVNRE